MEGVVVSGVSFVKPHFIAELGCEGLSLKEIAVSLGIEYKHAREAYDKSLSDYTGVEVSTPVDSGPIRGIIQVMVPHLSTDDAKFFVTQSRTPAGKGYCRFLIECEKVALSTPQFSLPKTYVEALRALAETEEQKQLALNAAAESQAVVDDLCNRHDAMALTKALKEIRVKPLKGLAYLREKGVLTLSNLPTSPQMGTGRFVIKSTQCADQVIRQQTLVTGTGLVWLRSFKWAQECRE